MFKKIEEEKYQKSAERKERQKEREDTQRKSMNLEWAWHSLMEPSTWVPDQLL